MKTGVAGVRDHWASDALFTSPVEEVRERLRSLAETGVTSVEIDTIGTMLYSLAKPSAK